MKQITGLLVLTCLLVLASMVVHASRRIYQNHQNCCNKTMKKETGHMTAPDVYVQPLFVFD